MDPRQHQARSGAFRDAREWMDAEQEGREDLAELAFTRLMSALPPVEPSEAFVAAVAHRAMHAHARTRRVQRLARMAAVMLVAGVSVAAIVALGSAAAAALSGAASLLSDGVVWLVRTAGGGIKWWSLAARVGGAVGASILTPTTVTAIVTIELLGISAIYALQRVLRYEGLDSQQAHI